MNPDTKDFLLHLYDKLWENMGAKEGRLWNYLSIYGAAVALALGAGGFGGVQLQAVILVLLLTTWAVLIVINANWWYQRNRLMVTQIEKRFAEGGQLDGVIPRRYRDAVFQVDRLYRGSVVILCALALLLYLWAMWRHVATAEIHDQDTLYMLASLYLVSVLGIMYCTAHHESYITTFYSAKEQLLLEGDPKENVKSLPEQESTARRTYGWKTYSLIALVFAMTTFDLMPVRAALPSSVQTTSGTLLQAISIVLFYIILGLPRSSAFRKSWWPRVAVFAMVLSSAVVLLYQQALRLRP